MGVSPITFEAMEAMERKLLIHIPAWEAKLICRIDDAVVAALTDKALSRTTQSQGRKGAAPPESSQIPVTNTAGIGALLRGLAARKAHLGPKVAPDDG